MSFRRPVAAFLGVVVSAFVISLSVGFLVAAYRFEHGWRAAVLVLSGALSGAFGLGLAWGVVQWVDSWTND